MSNKLKKFWKSLGPGLITGASDNEPSAIATYSIAGAKFGLGMLWASLFSLPLMIAVQEMSARIGRVSNLGLAGNMKKHYPKWVMIFISILIVSVNTINIGADMAGMAQAMTLITPFPEKLTASVMTFAILLIILALSYQKIFTIFKWLSIALATYILTVFTIHQNWLEILYHAIVPSLQFSKEFFVVLIAFFGTTISPYLYFWQASQEVEEKTLEQCKPGRTCRLKPATEQELEDLKTDTRVGMSFSNIITFFIIILTASTLFRAGFNNIETLRDAALVLKPLAGEYAFLLFTVGIIGAGFLAIPVLAGSAAYVVAEVFGWSEGLNKSFTKAKEFYGIVIASTIIGLLIPLLGFHPVKALFYTSLLYGVISPFLILMVLHMANNKKIMGEHTNGPWLNFFGHVALWVMTASAILIFFIL
ncbi:MAG: Nramp family divalent metal transporter [Candidatus Yanofskybacteria bacterium]|nr:Nramp family divalent metal transporter [Candidatus Yanofskybacteria bacterium]